MIDGRLDRYWLLSPIMNLGQPEEMCWKKHLRSGTYLILKVFGWEMVRLETNRFWQWSLHWHYCAD